MTKLAKTGAEILALPVRLTGEREEHRLAEGGVPLTTVRDYLCEVLALFFRVAGVSHKLGEDWQEPVYVALVRAGVVNGGEYLEHEDTELNTMWYWMHWLQDADEYVNRAIAALAGKS